MKESQCFRKAERLKKNFEFRKVYKNGAVYRNGVFTLTICGNDKKNHRLGISISSSKLSLASKRNYLKRIIKEVFRIHKAELINGTYDMIVSLAKPLSRKIDYDEAKKSLLRLMEKAGILQ